MTLLIFGFGFTLSAAFLWNEASTFVEYTNNMYITTSQAVVIIAYAIVVFKMDKLFEYISDWEIVTEQSK